MQTIVIPKVSQGRANAVERFAKVLCALDPEKAFEVTTREKKRQRSDPQLRYLNGVCYKLIGDAIGYERDEISEFMCGAYFGWKDKKVPKKPSNPTGVESVPVRTTTTDENGERRVLTKQEFADFIAYVQRFAASKGVFIPDPEL